MSDAMVSSHSLSNVLNSIAGGLLKKTNFTVKQYYSRLSAIVEAGLVTRKNRKYSLTSLGKIVYRLQITT